MACVEAKQGAVAGHPSDGENLKTSKTALEFQNPSQIGELRGSILEVSVLGLESSWRNFFRLLLIWQVFVVKILAMDSS
jgi:hypothetical protein